MHLGKNKVLSFALGKDPESEQKTNLHRVCSHLKGNKALLFTDCTVDQVKNGTRDVQNEEVTFALEARWSKDGSFESFVNE